MLITNPFNYLGLGARLRYVRQCSTGYRIDGQGHLAGGLRGMRRELTEIGFLVSLEVFHTSLGPTLEQFERLESEANGTPVLLDEATAQTLNQGTTLLESAVFAEAKTRFIAVPRRARIQWEQLISKPAELLGDGVCALLPPIAQRDWTDGCRALALEASTGSAFHLLRCLEACVRQLYTAYFPRKKVINQTWGQLTTQLRQKPKAPRPDLILLNHLDHLRSNFRNPTDHPDKFYEIEEAEDLLHLVADAVRRCVQDKRVRKQSPA